MDASFVENHVDGFEEFKGFVRTFSLGYVSEATGLSEEALLRFADTIAAGKRVSFWWTMGVNQSHEGVRLAQSLINLALITGNIGRPGTGANSITGQCNAMGSRLFSNTSSLIGGHDFGNEEHRRKVAEVLEIDPDRVPAENGWAYDQIVEGIESGAIKGLWIIATNSAHSWIGQGRFREALKKLEFLVVQDMYHSTETAVEADLVLPAAGWGEREGTFINSERRIGRTRKVKRAPGNALADFSIFRLIARFWGCGEMFKSWDTPESVFKLMTRLTEGRPCDISGIEDYAMLDQRGGIQWPYPQVGADERIERRLFEDGRFYHANERAKLIYETPRAPAEMPDEQFPFTLLTGRGTSSQWHTQTRTGKSAVLRKLYPSEIYVEINPHDAAELGVETGDPLEIRSRRGTIQAAAFVAPTVRRGQIFVPMHYAKANLLTAPSFDPYSRQPSYKHCAVAVRAID